MSEIWTRRQFAGTLSLAALSGIFVPKFGRWFRPNTETRTVVGTEQHHYATGTWVMSGGVWVPVQGSALHYGYA